MKQWELEEQRKKFINEFYFEKLNFCGCGSPCEVLYVIKNLLNVIKINKDRWKLPDYNKNSYKYYDLHQSEIIQCFNLKNDNTNDGEYSINEGVIQCFLNVLNNVDVLEHGSSIGGSWLTKYGEQLLEYLNELNDEELEWILD